MLARTDPVATNATKPATKPRTRSNQPILLNNSAIVAPIGQAIAEHDKLAALTLEVEEKVSAAIAKLKEKGLVSPYLRSFVVARINPLRWIQGEIPPAEKVLTQMRDRAAKFDASKVKQDDLAKMGGGVPDEEG